MSHICVPNMSHSVNIRKQIVQGLPPSHHLFLNLLLFSLVCLISPSSSRISVFPSYNIMFSFCISFFTLNPYILQKCFQLFLESLPYFSTSALTSAPPNFLPELINRFLTCVPTLELPLP